MSSEDDEWLAELSEAQQQEQDEIVMMVSQLSERAIHVEYSFRGYDRTHLLEIQGTKCYGLAPKVHAFLSGAMAMSNAYEWEKARRAVG